MPVFIRRNTHFFQSLSFSFSLFVRLFVCLVLYFFVCIHFDSCRAYFSLAALTHCRVCSKWFMFIYFLLFYTISRFDMRAYHLDNSIEFVLVPLPLQNSLNFKIDWNCTGCFFEIWLHHSFKAHSPTHRDECKRKPFVFRWNWIKVCAQFFFSLFTLPSPNSLSSIDV